MQSAYFCKVCLAQDDLDLRGRILDAPPPPKSIRNTPLTPAAAAAGKDTVTTRPHDNDILSSGSPFPAAAAAATGCDSGGVGGGDSGAVSDLEVAGPASAMLLFAEAAEVKAAEAIEERRVARERAAERAAKLAAEASAAAKTAEAAYREAEVCHFSVSSFPLLC